MQRETKSVGIHNVKEAGGEGRIEAIVSVFGNIDSYGEVVMPGAFTKSIERKAPIGVLSHDWTKPIAATLEVEEIMPFDERLPEAIKAYGGLRIVGEFYPDIEDSWQAYLKIKRGLFKEFSIGYNVVKDEWKDGTRQLHEIELHEWSPVLVGANPATSLLQVKAGAYADHVELLDAEVREVIARTKAYGEMRLKEGRVLSARNAAALTTLADTLKAGISEIERILSEAAPKPKVTPTDDAKAKLLIAQLMLNEAFNQ